MRHWRSRREVPIVDVCCVALLPVFISLCKFLEGPSADDWLRECAFNRSTREAIIPHHQCPLRSQHLGGIFLWDDKKTILENAQIRARARAVRAFGLGYWRRIRAG